MKNRNEKWISADGILKCNKYMLSCAILLLIVGVVFVFEADRNVLATGMSKGILQILWALGGLFFALVFLLINYKKLANEKMLIFFLWLFTIPLIVLALFSVANIIYSTSQGYGPRGLPPHLRLSWSDPIFSIRNINGAYRWIRVFGLSLQPSIFVQIFLILFVALKLSKDDTKTNGNGRISASAAELQFRKKGKKKPKSLKKQSRTKTEIVVDLISKTITAIKEHSVISVPFFIFLLVFAQPSTTIALTILTTVFAMFALKNHKKLFTKNSLLIMIGIFFVFVMFWNAFPHISGRIVGGGNNFQSHQARLAVGSGGITGLGIGQSEAKHSRLPEIENDYIFALIAEETGFVGSFIFIFVYVAFILMGFWSAKRAQDQFGRFVAFGITINYTFAFLLHLFVNLGIISTGAGLPFVSYGGTAMLADSVALGLLLNISGSSRFERIRK